MANLERSNNNVKALRARKLEFDSDSLFLTVIKAINQMYEGGTRIVSTKRLRKRFMIGSGERKLIRKIRDVLLWLERFNCLELEKSNPNRYRILSSFQENIENLIQTYHSRFSGMVIMGRAVKR